MIQTIINTSQTVSDIEVRENDAAVLITLAGGICISVATTDVFSVRLSTMDGTSYLIVATETAQTCVTLNKADIDQTVQLVKAFAQAFGKVGFAVDGTPKNWRNN